MMKSILAVAILAIGTAGAKAAQIDINTVVMNATQAALGDVGTRAVEFKIGDTTSYNLNGGGGLISGTMVMTVTKVTDTEVTMTQEIDLGMMGKQSCESVADITTGKPKSIVCNGQPQPTDQADEMEVIETKADNIKVPAGTFECLYVKAKNKKTNKLSEIWIAPKLVPLGGMLKMITEQDMIGKIEIELTSFKKN